MARLVFAVLAFCAPLAACSEAEDDPAASTTGAWQVRADAPVALGGHAATVAGGRAHVAGRQPTGELDKAVRLYDLAADAWSGGVDLPEPRFSLAMASVGEDVYALGGSYGYDSHVQTSAWVLSSQAISWKAIAALPTQRTQAAAVSVSGKLLLLGGTSESSIASSTLEYDPATDAWTNRADLPTPRAALAAVEHDGRVYAIGGYVQSAGATHPSSAFEVYEPATNGWQALAPMPTPRSQLGAAVVDGRIYAIGGIGEYNTQPLNTVEVFDPASQTWQEAEPMPVPRAGAATIVWQQRAYVIGGAESLDEIMTPTVLAFSP